MIGRGPGRDAKPSAPNSFDIRRERPTPRRLEACFDLRSEALKQLGAVLEAVVCKPSRNAAQGSKFVRQRFAEYADQAVRKPPAFWPLALDLLKLREHFGTRRLASARQSAG